MPTERTAYKELRKARLRHLKNISTKSELKTSIKKFEKLISDKKADEAKGFLRVLASKIDKAASKGVVTRKAAHRKISRLAKRLSRSTKA